MNLISLNIWGGRIHEPLLDFLNKQKETTDIFCFQEVYKSDSDRLKDGEVYVNVYQDLINTLPDYVGYFLPTEDMWAESGPTDYPLEYGLAIFIKKDIEVIKCQNNFVHKYWKAERSDIGYSAARAVQYLNFIFNNKNYTVLNFHGLHNGLGKGDCEERLVQANNIRSILDKAEGRKLICGDFNMLPETDSIKIIEGDMRNLIKENNVTSTRSSYYKKELRFADYIIIDKEMEVKDFQVLEDEVSDHLPLYLEFE